MTGVYNANQNSLSRMLSRKISNIYYCIDICWSVSPEMEVLFFPVDLPFTYPGRIFCQDSFLSKISAQISPLLDAQVHLTAIVFPNDFTKSVITIS